MNAISIDVHQRNISQDNATCQIASQQPGVHSIPSNCPHSETCRRVSNDVVPSPKHQTFDSIYITELFLFSICSLEGVNRIVVPFMACGDLSGYDADQTHPLTTSSRDKEYQSLSPTQEPINPPYKTACLLKKTNGLASTESIGQEFNSAVCESNVSS